MMKGMVLDRAGEGWGKGVILETTSEFETFSASIYSTSAFEAGETQAEARDLTVVAFVSSLIQNSSPLRRVWRLRFSEEE